MRVTKVGNALPFPVLGHLDQGTKTKNWTNNLVDNFCCLDKTGLEEDIAFQEIEFEVVDGCYADQGCNNQDREQVEVISNKRG